MANPLTRGVQIILLVAMVLFGAFFIYKGFHAILRQQQTMSFKPTTGIMVSSSIGQNSTGRNAAGQPAGPEQVAYYPIVVFSYSVDGQRYTGRHYNEADMYGLSQNDVESIVNQYPAGKVCTIYYNPANPADSILQRDLGAAPYIFILVGILIIVAGLFIFSRTTGVRFKNQER